jgi:hypothetical protein
MELAMNRPARRIALGAAAAAWLVSGQSPAPAGLPWMTETAMRAAFIGKTLDGHYGNGLTWTETYFQDGRLDYRETGRRAVGKWHFRGNVFCTFYDAEQALPPLAGGCWTTLKTGANCYEFYVAGLSSEDDFDGGSTRRWNARGWRQGEPSTCQDKPSV